MDSKSGFPASDDHESAPPSYTETLSPSSLSNLSNLSNLFPCSASSTSQFYSAQIQDQLLSLTSQIRSRQTQKFVVNHGNDERILSLMASEVQTFFADFANSGLQRGALVLVPSGAVQEGATPMSDDFRDPEEFDRVVRLSSKAIESGEWYWRDEDMAKRLARYLSPKPDWDDLPSRTDDRSPDAESMSSPGDNAPRRGFGGRKERSPVEEMQKQSRGGFFSFRKKGTVSAIERPPAAEERDMKASPGGKSEGTGSDDTIILDIKADDMAFRMENEMGIFETRRGWAIVVKLNVVMGKR